MNQQNTFRHFATMIDCSRNAVMRPESVCRWADLTSSLGFNTLMLYIEDLYEVDGHPYFGYGRGRYSKEELKQISSYCSSKGMEFIPCIQTLAHVDGIVRWKEYSPYIDANDILLIGDERTYSLIDGMFRTLSECCSSRIVNIGMDEAHFVGRGKYYDQHGDRDKTELLLEHLNRVAEIGKKYGFTLLMWSDMFYRIASGGDYYCVSDHLDLSVGKLIPDNVELVYWDYYTKDENRYHYMIASHESMKPGTWFAGGSWTWGGFAPNNASSIENTKSAISACRKNNVQDVVLTLWGDDGGECSRFTALPSLFYASQLAAGNTDDDDIRQKFEARFGIQFDDFMLCDLPKPEDRSKLCNKEKYLFYNDPFLGLLNSALSGDEQAAYKEFARKLGSIPHNAYSMQFDTLQALCEVLAVKADLSQRTRLAYSSGDRDQARILLADYDAVIEKTEVFYEALREQWHAENKPQGFEVQDIRFGGVMQRMKNCRRTLQKYADGEIDVIPELEEETLPCIDTYMDGSYFNVWNRMVSPGRVVFVV